MLYYARAKNVVPYVIPELRRELNPLDDLTAFLKICRLIAREKPDIIHTHTAKAGTLGRLAGISYNLMAASKVKLIHTFHGHVFEGYFGRLKTRIFIFIERFLAYFSSKVITVSSAVKEELIALGISGSDKIKVVPLGLELGKFLELPFEEKAGRCLNIGIVGRLVPIKNHRLFLEGAAKVIRDNPGLELRFKVIGDGELRAELEEFTRKLNLSSKVEFRGWQKDLSVVYADLDIVCLTSINEGTPVSLIEAMASGKAIAATDAGGVKDLLGESLNGFDGLVGLSACKRGVMARSGDADSFAGALSFLIGNEGVREKMAASGREFVREKFAKERLIKDIESLYEQAMSRQ